MRHLRGRCTTLAVVAAALLLSSCRQTAPAPDFWANFAFEADEEGRILPAGDSVALPPAEGYDAIIKADSTYYYLRNRDDLRMDVYLPRLGVRDVMIGYLVHNDAAYFTYRHYWSNEEGRWKVAVTKLGGQPQVLGDCIGYDAAHLLVMTGDTRTTYSYDLQPASTAASVECEVFPPGPSQSSG